MNLTLHNQAAGLRYHRLWVTLGIVLLGILTSASLWPMSLEGHAPRFTDKFLHVFAYFAVSGWFLQIYRGRRERWSVVAGMFAFGLMIELVQPWFPPRSGNLQDLAANASGIALAWFVSYCCLKNTLWQFENHFLVRPRGQ